MGIPYYFYTIYKKYAHSKMMLTEHVIAKKHIDHLFFDYNSLIHPCAQKVMLDDKDEHKDIEASIIDSCITYTRYIIHTLKPKCVYIMIDGVAPRAKMNQQRERRYKSYFFKLLPTCDNDNDNDNNVDTSSKWDSNKITPGTYFMSRIGDALQNLKKEMEMLSVCNVHISDSNEPGEGEHKMMTLIERSASILPTDTICIYGLDADLIMLGMLCQKTSNIILIRDNTFNSKAKECERTYTYLDILKLKGAIVQEIVGMCKQECAHVELSQQSENNIVCDYIFLCFLLGNDFLHHVPSLVIKENAVNVLLKYYIKVLVQNFNNNTFTFLINPSSELSDRINLPMLRSIFGHLASSEEYFFTHVWSVYKSKSPVYKDTYSIKDLSEKTTSQLCFFKDDIIRYNLSGFKTRYYLYYGIHDVDEACQNYIQGLFWVLGYYQQHSHKNWIWFYNFHNTPLISDLYAYLLKQSSNFEELKTNVKKNIDVPSAPFSCLQQLFMVLPKESLLAILKDATPEKYYTKMKRILNVKSISLQKNYPQLLSFDTIHKEYLWQTKIFFDQIDIRFLESIM